MKKDALNPFTLKCSSRSQNWTKKIQISFFKTLKNEWYHVKVQPKRFHLSSHIKRFRSRTQTLELHTKQIVPRESTAEEVSFEWSHNRISSTDSKVRTTCTKQIVPCENTAEEVSFEWSHHRNSSTDSKVRTTY